MDYLIVEKIDKMLNEITTDHKWTKVNYFEHNGLKDATTEEKLQFLIDDFYSMSQELQSIYEDQAGEGI